MAPEACQVFDNPFNARYVFWFAWGKGYHDTEASIDAMGSSHAPGAFCVSDYMKSGSIPSFIYEVENASNEACGSAPQYGWWIVPQMADTWINPTVNFTGH